MFKLGIIAEDDSDIKALWNLAKRIRQNKNLPKLKKHAAKGSGKLKQKCGKIAMFWIEQGVKYIIICHDLDSQDQASHRKLRNVLNQKISQISGYKKIICIVIPIEELEAWFLSDTKMLEEKFNGIRLKSISNPQKIKNPKEYIIKASRKKSKPRYVPQIHNENLAEIVDIEKIRNKCPSFRPFYEFIRKMKI